MCVVSMIMDYGRDRLRPEDWNQKNYEQFRKLVEQAERFDKYANQPHCEDPEKMKLLKSIEERLAAIEKKMARKKTTKRKAK